MGHTVIDIPGNKNTPVNVALNSLGVPVDFVLLELYGNSVPIDGVRECDHELVAYCIDSPLNMFWLKEACSLFDHVFVDQQSSVEELRKDGINACWLPLCCQQSYFVEPQEKIYDISFIGTINKHRLKRSNLLDHIQKQFTINLVQHVSMREAQKIFAQSRIVLNENIFSGLTLRVFQGLAANALVLTEKGAAGVDSCFVDGEHLVEFTPYDVLEKLHSLLADSERREEIAHAGRLLCEQEHTSTSRAKALLSAIHDKTACNPRQDDACRQWRDLRARYMFAMRFGGGLNDIMQGLESIARSHQPYAPDALLKLGDIYARSGHPQRAEYCYTTSAQMQDDYKAWVKLALLHVSGNAVTKANTAINNALKKSACASLVYDDILIKLDDDISRVLFLAAKLYFLHGAVFDMGFIKFFKDIVPDTATDVAFMLWEHKPCPQTMELLLDCVAEHHLEGELLPELLSGIRKGCLSDSQILHTAKIAARYYDLKTADTILSAYKASKHI